MKKVIASSLIAILAMANVATAQTVPEAGVVTQGTGTAGALAGTTVSTAAIVGGVIVVAGIAIAAGGGDGDSSTTTTTTTSD